MMPARLFQRTLPLGLVGSLLLSALPRATMGQEPVPRKIPGVGYNHGDIAPELTLTDQHDNPVSLLHYRGQNVLLLFSAAWCGPCAAAAEVAEPFVHALNEAGEPTALVEVLVQNLYGDPSETIDAVDWAEEFNLSTPVLSCGGDYDSPALTQFIEYSRRYGGPAFPTAVLLSPNGRVIQVYTGFPWGKIAADFLQQRSYSERSVIDRMLTTVERLKLGDDRTPRLADPLRAALAALDRRQWDAGCQQMALFAEQLAALDEATLDADIFKHLTETTEKIQYDLGCD